MGGGRGREARGRKGEGITGEKRRGRSYFSAYNRHDEKELNVRFQDIAEKRVAGRRVNGDNDQADHSKWEHTAAVCLECWSEYGVSGALLPGSIVSQ